MDESLQSFFSVDNIANRLEAKLAEDKVAMKKLMNDFIPVGEFESSCQRPVDLQGSFNRNLKNEDAFYLREIECYKEPTGGEIENFEFDRYLKSTNNNWFDYYNREMTVSRDEAFYNKFDWENKEAYDNKTYKLGYRALETSPYEELAKDNINAQEYIRLKIENDYKRAEKVLNSSLSERVAEKLKRNNLNLEFKI